MAIDGRPNLAALPVLLLWLYPEKLPIAYSVHVTERPELAVWTIVSLQRIEITQHAGEVPARLEALRAAAPGRAGLISCRPARCRAPKTEPGSGGRLRFPRSPGPRDAGRKRLAFLPEPVRDALPGEQRLERFGHFVVAVVDMDRAGFLAGVLQHQARDRRVDVEIDAQALHEPALLRDRLGDEIALVAGLVRQPLRASPASARPR
jgi:hypothetical protein